jgi:hypothetical protein
MSQEAAAGAGPCRPVHPCRLLPERSTNSPDGGAPLAHARVMSMSEPFQPNLPQSSADGGVLPDDDLSVDDELAAADDLDADGAPVGEGEPGADDDLSELPENPLFRTPEPGDRLSPEDLED